MVSPERSYASIYAVVRRIPRGRVATYGQIAALAGRPRQARLVGYALHALPAGSGIPWHRVVNARGEVSPRRDGLGYEEVQVRLLKKEGVTVTGGALSLERHQWRPRAARQVAGRDPFR